VKLVATALEKNEYTYHMNPHQGLHKGSNSGGAQHYKKSQKYPFFLLFQGKVGYIYVFTENSGGARAPLAPLLMQALLMP